MSAHKELIARLEGLEGPCRECDAEIASVILVCGGLYDEADPTENGYLNLYLKGKRVAKIKASEYTSSIDAALTLVPDGWEWEIEYNMISDYTAYHMVSDYMAYQVHMGQTIIVENVSLPIAICIASLKAGLAESKRRV